MTNKITKRSLNEEGQVVFHELVEVPRVASPDEVNQDRALYESLDDELEELESRETELESDLEDTREKISEIKEEMEAFAIYNSDDDDEDSSEE